MSLTARTSKAVGWTTLAKIIQQAFQFGLSVVLMRLLGPKAFGLIGMVLVFSGFAGIFQELGFSSALVQHQKLREEHRSTIFWLTLGMGGLLTLLLILAAPWIAVFYKEPLLKPMSVWLAFSFLLATPGMVPRALLQKDMRFDVLAKTDVAATLVSGVVAAVMAIKGFGVWSLVAQQLIAAGIASASLFLFVDWRPKFLWSRSGFRELLGYGAGLTGFNIVNYWARSADKLLIGKFMDATALGLYSRAYSLMLLPLTQVVSVLAPVMFPALSSIQDDKPRVRNAYLRVTRLLTFITFPMMLGLAVVAKPFVLALFGEQWVSIIPLIQILSFVGMTQTLCNPTGWIYLSQGRTDWFFWWGLLGSGFMIISIAIGVLFGRVESVAWAYLIGSLIETVPSIMIPGWLINMRVRDVWFSVQKNLFGAGIMAIIILGVSQILSERLKPLYQLVILVTLGIGIYALIMWLIAGAVYKDIFNITKNARLKAVVQPILPIDSTQE
jgi:O-antigen/teichoic acid export membrane protein